MLRARQRRIRPGAKQRRFRQRLSAYRETRGRRTRKRIPRAAVPSFFTLMNLFCGFLSLIQTHEGNLEYAAWLIVLAGFFDLLDGMMARLTDGSSLFGVELDSLSDIVSFGVAPAFLIYVFGLEDFGILGVIVASLPAICGAVRLARFNVNFDGEKGAYFTGLPIPVQATTIIVVVLNAGNMPFLDPSGPDHLTVLIPIVVALGGLMITNIEFDIVPKPSAHFIRTHPVKAFLWIVCIGLVFVFQELGLFIGLVVYFLFGIGRAVIRLVQAVWTTDPDSMQGDS